jgi:hypothetical protein
MTSCSADFPRTTLPMEDRNVLDSVPTRWPPEGQEGTRALRHPPREVDGRSVAVDRDCLDARPCHRLTARQFKLPGLVPADPRRVSRLCLGARDMSPELPRILVFHGASFLPSTAQTVFPSPSPSPRAVSHLSVTALAVLAAHESPLAPQPVAPSAAAKIATVAARIPVLMVWVIGNFGFRCDERRPTLNGPARSRGDRSGQRPRMLPPSQVGSPTGRVRAVTEAVRHRRSAGLTSQPLANTAQCRATGETQVWCVASGQPGLCVRGVFAPATWSIVAACVRSSITAESGTSTTSALLTSASSTPAWTSVQPKLVEQRPDCRHVLVVADAL